MTTMKLILLIFTIVVAALYCNGDTNSMDASDPDYPGMCVYKRTPYPPGDHKIESRCIRITCSEKGWLSEHSCVKQAKIPGCFRGAYLDRKRPFPECCKRLYSCTYENGTEYMMEEY